MFLDHVTCFLDPVTCFGIMSNILGSRHIVYGYNLTVMQDPLYNTYILRVSISDAGRPDTGRLDSRIGIHNRIMKNGFQ